MWINIVLARLFIMRSIRLDLSFFFSIFVSIDSVLPTRNDRK